VNPYLQDADFTLYNGDAREVLAELNERYCQLAAERTKQLSLLGEDLTPAAEATASS
jgi:hypothetical protein